MKLVAGGVAVSKEREAVAHMVGTTRDVLGVATRIEVEDRRCAAQLDRALRDLPIVSAAPERTLSLRFETSARLVLHDGENLVRRGMEPPEALALVLWYLHRIASSSTRAVVVHAGCVALNGHALILPAPMDAGKSTLVTALVRDGWSYLTDELAGLRAEDGCVVPYPHPVALDASGSHLFGELRSCFDPPYREADRVRYLPSELRPGCLTGPSALAAIVFPRYAPGEKCALAPVGRAEALHTIAQQTLNLAALGRRAFPPLRRLVTEVPAYRMKSSDLDEAVAVLRSLVN